MFMFLQVYTIRWQISSEQKNLRINIITDDNNNMYCWIL